MPPRLFLGIPNYNGEKSGVLWPCLKAVSRTLENVPSMVVSGDDCSTDDSPGLLDEARRKWGFEWFRREMNQGFVHNANDLLIRGLRSKAPYIGLLNTDTQPTGRCWPKMLAALHAVPRAGAVTAMGAKGVAGPGADVVGVDHRERWLEGLVERLHGEAWFEQPRLCFFAVVFRREAVEDVGLLDEAFAPGMYDDADYSIRLLDRGWKLLMASTAYMHHREHTTFDREVPAWKGALLQRNREYLFAKHGLQRVLRGFEGIPEEALPDLSREAAVRLRAVAG